MGDTDRIEVRVSDDRLEAWVSLAEGAPVARGDAELAIEAAMHAAGVGEGVDPEGIGRAAARLELTSACPQEILVARGTRAEAAEPTRLELDHPVGPIAGRVDDDDRIDFWMRDLMIPVEIGEALGRVLPERPGKPGVDVFGEAIAAEPSVKPPFSLGQGISVDDDGTVRASRVGARTVTADGTLEVVELYTHSAPVDLRSGHLETRGSLSVARDVEEGFRVTATHDLMIGGTLDGGRAKAGGSIEILGGAIGRDRGRVEAGGDARLRHTLGIRVSCKGTLFVQRSVSASHLEAAEVVVEGNALGDAIYAERSITVREAGSRAGGPCHLRVAHLLERHPAKALPSASGRHKRRGADRGNGKKDRRRRARSTSDERTRRRELEVRIEERRRERALREQAHIDVTGLAHAGCRIDFGVTPLVLEETMRARRFRFDKASDSIIDEDLP